MMNTKNNPLERALTQGYDLNFSQVFEKSFDNFKKTWALSGLAFIVMGIFLFALSVGALILVLGATVFSEVANLENLANLEEQLRLSTMDTLYLFLYILGLALFYGLYYVFIGGLFKMINDADQNKAVTFDSLFFYFRSAHFLQLFLAGAIYSATTNIIMFLFDHLENPLLGSLFGTIVGYVLSFLTILVIPLIIFSNNNALNSISNSVRLLLKQPLIALALAIVALILSLVGVFAICIGYLFTLGFNFIVHYYIYLSAVPHNTGSDLDLIGLKEEE